MMSSRHGPKPTDEELIAIRFHAQVRSARAKRRHIPITLATLKCLEKPADDVIEEPRRTRRPATANRAGR